MDTGHTALLLSLQLRQTLESGVKLAPDLPAVGPGQGRPELLHLPGLLLDHQLERVHLVCLELFGDLRVCWTRT